MSYQVLARKWRPAQFEEVIGQSHVVTALSNALDQDRVHHAFLFTGTRGVGKTTLARIFAKALNCENGVSSKSCGVCASCVAVSEGRFIDLIEVDAASRTKVDDTRELLDNVQYAPTQGRYKVYLIDEVHMLSTHSFNALLKTLEEPPEHVKFLLATTDPQKLPMTVLSRCIQFSLNAIELPAIERQLKLILDSESIEHEQNALTLLGRAADGSLRDALSLLDQAIAYSDKQLSEAGVRNMLGLVDGQAIIAILEALALNDADALMLTVQELIHAAQDLKTVLDDLLSYIHALSLYQFAPAAVEWKGLDDQGLKSLADQLQPEVLQLYYQITLNGKRDFSLAPDPRTGFEMVLLRLLAFKPGETGSKIAAKSGKKSTDGAVKKPGEPARLAQREPNAKDDKGLDHIQSDSLMADTSNLAEEVEPFLSNGLQNNNLQKHLIAASELKPHRDKAADNIQPVEAKAKPEQHKTRQPKDSACVTKIDSLISNMGDWSDFVVKTDLKGMARQLAVHMTPISFAAGILKLQLDKQYSNLRSEERIEQILNALQQESGETFKLEVQLGEVDKDNTAAGVIADRERASLEKTRQDFKENENIKELVSKFDAKIDESSIKSVN